MHAMLKIVYHSFACSSGPHFIRAGVHYRAPTRLGRVAEANYVISAFSPRQTRKKCFLGHDYESLRIDCRHTWECPRNQSGRARNAAENAYRSRTARTHLGSHQEWYNHGLGQSGWLSNNHLRRTSTRARTRSGQVAEANYVISAFCPRTSVGIIVPFVLTAGVS